MNNDCLSSLCIFLSCSFLLHTLPLRMMQTDLSLEPFSCAVWQELDSRASSYYSSVLLCVLNLSEPITRDCSVILAAYLSHLSSLLPLSKIWFSSHKHGLDFSSTSFSSFPLLFIMLFRFPLACAGDCLFGELGHSHCLHNRPVLCTASFNCWSLKWDSIKMNDLH